MSVHVYVRLLHTVQSDVMLCWNMLITHCHSGLQDVVCQSIFRWITDALVALDCLEMCLAVLKSLFGFDTPPNRNDFRLGLMQDYPLVLNSGFKCLVQNKADHISSFTFQLSSYEVFMSSTLQLCRCTLTSIGIFTKRISTSQSFPRSVGFRKRCSFQGQTNHTFPHKIVNTFFV